MVPPKPKATFGKGGTILCGLPKGVFDFAAKLCCWLLEKPAYQNLNFDDKSKILGFKRYALGRTAFKSKTLAFDIFAVITITQPPLTRNLRFRKQSFLWVIVITAKTT